MQTQPYAVIDVGKSGTRIKVHPSAEVLIGRGAQPELAGAPGAGRYLADLLAETWSRNGTDAALISAVLVGSTFEPSPAEQRACLAVLRDIWPNAAVTVVADGVLAHAAALGGPGTLASLGTGTSVIGMDSAHRLYQMDCWGPDLGDRGSAAELGRDGLRLACATVDGVADAHGLVRAARAWLGEVLDTPAAVRLLAAPDRAARIAEFATVVCHAAAGGDADAAKLVRRSARHAADTCAAMAAQVGSGTLVLRGRLATDPHFRAALVDALRAHTLSLSVNDRDVLDVAPAVVADPAYRRPPRRPAAGPVDPITPAPQES